LPSGGFLWANQLAGVGVPTVRTSLSAFLSTYLFAGCSFAKKLNTTNAAQNSNPTSTAAPEPKANNSDRPNHPETVQRGDAEKITPALPNTDLLIALVVARPEIKTVIRSDQQDHRDR
jgi:hypothetical protein